MLNLQDEYIHISIHPSELETIEGTRLRAIISAFVEEYKSIEFFPGGIKKGKPINKVNEFKKALKELVEVRKENKGEESNVECLVYDKIMELLQRMDLKQLRELKLEKLL